MMIPVAAFVGTLTATALVALAVRRRRERANAAAARADAERIRARARREASRVRRKAEGEARAEATDRRSRADQGQSQKLGEVERREGVAATGEDVLRDTRADLDARREELGERERQIEAVRARADETRERAREVWADVRRALERKADVSAEELATRAGQAWVDRARADAAQRTRAAEQSPADPAIARAAQRVLGVAVSRYQNHFLTERGQANVGITEACADALGADGVLPELQEVANVTLHLSESGASVRLEGLDGVGREVARRALAKLSKKPEAAREVRRDPRAFARGIREQLEQEIVGLGRKAFAVLKIPKAHPEIIELVGALNYRTSYTQNQWLHAVEASFLAGMMAEELELDRGTARRATLLHDIGKALTHQIEGSHAVIGADIARRLGEDEVVANAVGAHHDDEPPGSVYAHVVKAADAMSGARPGARREIGELYTSRLDDLERIGKRHPGVDQAYAVHGGRELRVYVREGELGDLEAVDLSSEIADQVAEELVFPGQIKVTVIRAYEAVAVAG